MRTYGVELTREEWIKLGQGVTVTRTIGAAEVTVSAPRTPKKERGKKKKGNGSGNNET